MKLVLQLDTQVISNNSCCGLPRKRPNTSLKKVPERSHIQMKNGWDRQATWCILITQQGIYKRYLAWQVHLYKPQTACSSTRATKTPKPKHACTHTTSFAPSGSRLYQRVNDHHWDSLPLLLQNAQQRKGLTNRNPPRPVMVGWWAIWGHLMPFGFFSGWNYPLDTTCSKINILFHR